MIRYVYEQSPRKFPQSTVSGCVRVRRSVVQAPWGRPQGFMKLGRGREGTRNKLERAGGVGPKVGRGFPRIWTTAGDWVWFDFWMSITYEMQTSGFNRNVQLCRVTTCDLWCVVPSRSINQILVGKSIFLKKLFWNPHARSFPIIKLVKILPVRVFRDAVLKIYGELIRWKP